jgi:hypothetical protein
MEATYVVLREAGAKRGQSLAEAFESFPRRKGHWTVRALLENSAHLKEYDYSFRRWLQSQCSDLGVNEFPPRDFRQTVRLGNQSLPLERALCVLLESFRQVGPQMSAYMLCDWQLALRREEKTKLFDNYKLDSNHDIFVKNRGEHRIPECKDGFTQWWHQQPGCQDLPPRLANECIWLAIDGDRKVQQRPQGKR